MLKVNLYDWSTAELIHTYVDIHYEDFVDRHIYGEDISELEYVESNLSDFREWAQYMGYEIVTDNLPTI